MTVLRLAKIVLYFSDLNQLSLMNTWFHSFHYGTWTRIVTKTCSMIDCVVVRSAPISLLLGCAGDVWSDLLDTP